MLDILAGSKTEVFTASDVYQNDVRDNEISWKLRTKKDGSLYAFFNSEEEVPVSLLINEKRVRGYFDGFGHPIIKLGDFPADTPVEVVMRADDSEQVISLTDAQFYQEDMESLTNTMNLLQSDPLIVDHFDNNHIDGKIQAEKDGQLFFSIPYDCRVDALY